MTDLPDKKTRPPGTEPVPAADAMPTTDGALTQPLETADVTPTARLDTARLDYDSPTVPLSPVDTKPVPASAAFTRARWAAGEGAGAASPPPPNDIAPVRLPPADPGSAGRIGANPGPPPQSVPPPVPPVSPAGAGVPTTPRAPSAPTRPPMARAAPAPRRRRPRRRPRFGTILWGVLLLGFAAFMVARTVLPAPPDPTFWLLGGVILVGLLLVVAGIAAASRRAG